LNRSCLVELIEKMPLQEMPLFLKEASPKELFSFHEEGKQSPDWTSLVLFPFIEYAVVQRCVFLQEDHPYCDSSRREKEHQRVDQKLLIMIESSNEELQYRGMLFACARRAAGRMQNISGDGTVRGESVTLFIQLCGQEKEERRELLKSSLHSNKKARAMALLSLMAEPDDSWKKKVLSWSTVELSPLEKLFIQEEFQGKQE
jgi:hypothetical protein